MAKGLGRLIVGTLALAAIIGTGGLAGVSGIGAVGGFLHGTNALQVLALGSALFGRKKKQRVPQPTYEGGDNLASPTDTLPVVYGKMRCVGKAVFERPDGGGAVRRFVIFSEGEVEDIHSPRVNLNPVDTTVLYIPGTVVGDIYTGTADQAKGSLLSDYRGGIPLLAGLDIRIQEGERLKDTPVVSAVVEGVKVRQWDGVDWSTAWTNNPSWIIYDMLTHTRRGCSIDPALLDHDTFKAFADHCAEVIPGEFVTTHENMALSATFTDATGATGGAAGYAKNNQVGDGAFPFWWTVVADTGLTLQPLGVIDLGSVRNIGAVVFYLWSADERNYRGYKVEVSDVSSTGPWELLEDTTAGGTIEGAFRGRQVVQAGGIEARYIRISGTGNTVNTGFFVNEVQVFAADPSPRHALNFQADPARPAEDWINDILEITGAWLYWTGTGWGIAWPGPATPEPFQFDESNIADGTMAIHGIRTDDRANQVAVVYWNELRDERAVAQFDDTANQEAVGIRRREVEFLQITSAGHAGRLARLIMNLAQMPRFTYTWSGQFDSVTVTAGDVVSLSHPLTGGVARLVRVQSVEESQDGVTSFTAIDHFDAIYSDAGTGEATVFDSPPGAGGSLTPGNVTNLSLSQTEFAQGDGTTVMQIEVDWVPPGGIIPAHEVQVSTDGGITFPQVFLVGHPIGVIPNATPGVTYHIRVIAINDKGLRGPTASAPVESITITPSTSVPDDVANMDATWVTPWITLEWDGVSNSDLSHYEIRWDTTAGGWSGATVLVSDIRATSYQFQELPGMVGETVTFYVKAVNRWGNPSDNAATDTVTAGSNLTNYTTAPSLSMGGGTVNDFNVQMARYTRRGNVVNFEIGLNWTSITSASGDIAIANGVPFAPSSTTTLRPVEIVVTNMNYHPPPGRVQLAAWVTGGGTTIGIGFLRDGDSTVSALASDFETGSPQVWISGSYFID